MKLEVGKYYRSSDGRKVGPMRWRPFNGNWDVDQFLHPLPDPLGYSLWREDGFGDEGVHLMAEWKEETTMDKITMDGKYAYRKDPFTQVRILCVDRPNVAHPILVMNSKGEFTFHSTTGASPYYPQQDLVPLQEKLPDLWVNLYDYGKGVQLIGSYNGTAYTSEQEALEGAMSSGGHYPREYKRTIKYIPAPDQTS